MWKTTFSSGARATEDLLANGDFDVVGDGALDEACVVLDEDGRWHAYARHWETLCEEKRLDLRAHARIKGASTTRDALGGISDVCDLFDDGDGYDDASLDLGGNDLGTRGLDEIWKKGSAAQPAPPLAARVRPRRHRTETSFETRTKTTSTSSPRGVAAPAVLSEEGAGRGRPASDADPDAVVARARQGSSDRKSVV